MSDNETEAAAEIRANLTAEERLELIDRVMRACFDATESWSDIGPSLAYWAWAVTDRDPDDAWVDWRDCHYGTEGVEARKLFFSLFPPTEAHNANVWAFIRM